MPILNLVTLFGLLVQSAEHDDPSFWSFLRSGTVLTRCPEKSRDRAEARQAWESLRDQVDALTEASDPAAALASMKALLRTPCFHLAAEQGEPPWPRHALALKTWWEDGGDSWLLSYVEPSEEGLTTDQRPVTVLPPEPRKVLFRETAADTQLAPILCAQADAVCGLATQGWVARANAALVPRPEAPGHWSEERQPESDPLAECGRAAGAQSKENAYTVWRTCLLSRRPRIGALPLGRTRAPDEGWLVVAGRRGHYQFCDEVRAYHLLTGAAYVAESCSALALEPGGGVNFEKTDDGRAVRMRVGRILVENLQEVVWFLMLRERVEQVGRLITYPIPRGMTVQFEIGSGGDQPSVSSIDGWSTAWTTLVWAWLRPGGAGNGGELTWPTGDDRAEAHAASLLDIAERSFAPGCPPALPPSIPATLVPGVSAGDARPSAFESVLEGLKQRLQGYRLPADCAPAAR